MSYSQKDIFIQRKNSHGKFEEYSFPVVANSVVTIDGNSDLKCIQNSIFTPVTSLTSISASYAKSSSISEFTKVAASASYVSSSAIHGIITNNISSSIISSISASISDLTIDVINKYIKFQSVYAPDSIDQNLIYILNHSGSRALDLYSNGSGGGIYSWDALTLFANGDIRINSAASNIILNDGIGSYVGVRMPIPIYAIDVNGQIGDSTSLNYLITNDSTASYINANGGNFGLGTVSPQFTLDVNGDIGNSNGSITFFGTSSYTISASYLDNPYFKFESVYIPDVVDQNLIHILNHSGSRALDLYSNGSGSGIYSWDFLNIISTNGTYIDVYNGGIYLNSNVGGFIGVKTNTPQYELDVNGRIGNSNGDLLFYTTESGRFGFSSEIDAQGITGSLYGTASYALNIIGSNTVDGTLTTNNTTYIAYQLPDQSAKSLFAEYVLYSGSNVRCGRIFGCWNGLSSSYTEFSSNDLGNTAQVTMSIQLILTTASLVVNSTTIGWTLKLSGKYI